MEKNELEFETLKSNKNRLYLFIGIVCVVVLLITVIVTNTFAKYRVTDTVPLINGRVNYTPYDFKIMAMYQENDSGEYVEIESMPTSGYVINEEMSYCTLDNVNHDEEARLYTDDRGQHVFSGLKKNSKCYVYFDEQLCPAGATACNTILAEKTINSSRSGAITGVLTTNTTGTVYSVADDDGTSYVYAGAPTDNWVSFAGFYWRIIRINGDGSIRMIYNGTSTTTTGTGTQITVDGTNTFRYNPTYGDNTYIGYMTGLENECASTISCSGTNRTTSYSEATNNTYDSNIKSILDDWYQNNLASHSQYISTEAGFCNDRQPQSGVMSGTSYGTLGYGTNATAYAPLGRLYQSGSWKSSQTPSLRCTNTNDLFTVSGSSKGNHDLTYPIGLITSDEVVLAGGFGRSANNSYYLYTNQAYWTMSPYYFYASNSRAGVFSVNSDGNLYTGYDVGYTGGVRPVINLSADVTISGSGTATEPYRIS